jgi:S-formylglutathione hydrolase FrmB
MRRFNWLLAGAMAVLFAGIAAGSATAATVTDDVAKSDRLHELTVDTDAFSEPTKVHVFLPTGYDANPDKRWPVTYALAGMQNNYDSFAKVLHGEELTSGYPSIVVSPDGNSGFWSDWYNTGAGGPPMYETFVIDQLVDLIDARYRTIADRAHRAIFGISMGGYGATSLAARHPDLFGSVATISGAVDSNNTLIGTTMSLASTFDGGAIDAINGPRGTEEVRWHGTNPTDLASNLRGMDIQVRTANGVLNPEIGEGDSPDDAVSCIVENGVYQGSTSFNAKLDELGVDHLWKDYGNGCHTVENFTREVVDTLDVFTENFAHPAAAPQSFNFKTIEPDFGIWGWQVKADPGRALEFMTVEGSETTLSLTGSGTTSVASPPAYKGLKAVDVNGKKTRPDGRGRISFKVDLGKPHSVQQYTAGASTSFVTKRVSFKPHALVKVTVAKRKGKGVRVCARALGGVVPKAKLKAGKLKGTMKIGPKAKCRTLKPHGRKKSGKPKQVVVSGRDSYGHAVKAKAKVRG